eukprot:m.125519 g.125519  ORF g.125519 m.125519 type:complete len:327 (-) comp14673_c4_seq6:45-1025(-)
MGRKKIEIKPITEDRNRQVTLTKRKFGVFKKAHELAVLTKSDVALIIFDSQNRLYQYSSKPMKDILTRIIENPNPTEIHNKESMVALIKKKKKSGDKDDEHETDDEAESAHEAAHPPGPAAAAAAAPDTRVSPSSPIPSTSTATNAATNSLFTAAAVTTPVSSHVPAHAPSTPSALQNGWSPTSSLALPPSNGSHSHPFPPASHTTSLSPPAVPNVSASTHPHGAASVGGAASSADPSKQREVMAFWSVSSLGELFHKLSLDAYIDRFVAQEVDLPTFLTLERADLVELGVSTFGAQKKMLTAIQELRSLRQSHSGFLESIFYSRQ